MYGTSHTSFNASQYSTNAGTSSLRHTSGHHHQVTTIRSPSLGQHHHHHQHHNRSPLSSHHHVNSRAAITTNPPEDDDLVPPLPVPLDKVLAGPELARVESVEQSLQTRAAPSHSRAVSDVLGIELFRHGTPHLYPSMSSSYYHHYHHHHHHHLNITIVITVIIIQYSTYLHALYSCEISVVGEIDPIG